MTILELLWRHVTRRGHVSASPSPWSRHRHSWLKVSLTPLLPCCRSIYPNPRSFELVSSISTFHYIHFSYKFAHFWRIQYLKTINIWIHIRLYIWFHIWTILVFINWTIQNCYETYLTLYIVHMWFHMVYIWFHIQFISAFISNSIHGLQNDI